MVKKSKTENIFCPNCGKKTSNKDKFCGFCGKTINLKFRDKNHVSKSESLKDKVKQDKIPIVIGICIICLIVYLSLNGNYDYSNQDLQQEEPFFETILYNSEENNNKDNYTVGEIESLIEESSDYSSNASAASIYFSNSIAKILCLEDYYSDYYFLGSGSIWKNNNEYWIMTNEHVLSEMEKCIAVVTKDWSEAAHDSLKAFQEDNILVYNIDLENSFYSVLDGYDLAYGMLEEISDINQPLNLLRDIALVPDTKNCNESYPIGTAIKIFGYPTIGSDTVITMTEGIISSFEKIDDAYYYLTSAKIEEGDSGGLAFTDISENASCVIGIPTFVLYGEVESLGRILDITEKEIEYLLSSISPSY